MRRALPWSLALLLGACSLHPLDQASCAALPGGARYCLQPSTAIAPFAVQQMLTVRTRGQSETLIVELEVDAQGMRLVGLTPLGHKVIQLAYEQGRVHTTTLPDARLNPTLLLSLMQLALWPVEAVRAGLQNPGELVENAGQRRFSVRGQTTLTIAVEGAQAPPERIRMALPAADLELNIETLSAADAP